MKFGRVDPHETIEFTLPPDNPDTERILRQNNVNNPFRVYVGCAKWNKQELKNFYPRGIKDELAYYSTQFNSIEMNTTFYRIPDAGQVVTWKEKTPEGFKFFPKVNQSISHIRRLNDVQPLVDQYCDQICHFEEKLGIVFLQLHSNFGYKNLERLVGFIENFPKSIPLAVELRHTEWFSNPAYSSEVYSLLENHQITNILVDTAGRRDLLHMRLTTPTVFIRYVGANNPEKDRERLDSWIDRLKIWVDLGLRDINFFVHQNIELESPLLSAYFIEKMNGEFGLALKIPSLQESKEIKRKQSDPPNQNGLTFDF
jgi:uncharacterized protein YecE (DUF72 family)